MYQNEEFNNFIFCPKLIQKGTFSAINSLTSRKVFLPNVTTKITFIPKIGE